MAAATMADRVVVVTGGTKGLGRALSIEFGEAGYYVVAVYRSDRAAADALATDLEKRQLRGIVIRHDVGDPEPFRGADGIESAHWTLINNAWPPVRLKPLHLTDESDLRDALGVGVTGAFRMTKTLLPRMARSGRGAIVNVVSSVVLADQAPKGFAAYAVGKFGLLGLTRAVAAEYGSHGVRVFSVAPGFMSTPMTEAWSEVVRAAVMAGSTPARPDDVARFIRERVEDPSTPGRGENYPVG